MGNELSTFKDGLNSTLISINNTFNGLQLTFVINILISKQIMIK